MAKRAKRWAILAAVLFVLPAAGLLAATALIDPNQYKPRIAALVADQTGRTLSIDGPIRIGWRLRPTISISGVRLSNLPGGSRPDMARVERIEATLSLPALLRGEIRVAQLLLVGPNILLEPVQGRANWVFRPRGTGAAAAPSHGPGLWIAAAHVRNGMVTLRFPARTNVIGLRSLDYAHASWTDPLRLDAVLVYRDFQPFTAHAEAVPTGGTLDPWTTRFRASAFDADVEAGGTASLDGPFAVALSLRAPALERLNQLLPSMRLPALHGLTLKTNLSSPRPGVLPIPGRTSLRVASVDLGDRIPGLFLSDLRLDLPRENGVAALAASGRYGSQLFSVSGSARMPPRFDGRASEPVALSAWPGTAAAPGDGDALSVRGAMSLDDGAFAGFDGALSLQAASLAAFRPIAWPALPALTALRLDAAIALPAGLDRLLLRQLSLRAAEGDLEGDATVRLGPAPGAETRLHSTRLALDTLLPVAARDPSPGAAPFMTARLPWEALRNGAFDVDWRADHLVYRGQDWPGPGLHAVLGHGALEVALSGPLLHGRIAASAANPSSPGVDLVLGADALPLRPLAVLAGLPSPTDDPVSGTLRLALALSAHGTTPRALAGSLDGSIDLSTDDAALSDEALAVLAAPALKQLGTRPSPGRRTVVRCLVLRGAARNGLLKLSTLALDAGDLVLAGVGEVDLARDTLALKLHPLARLAGSRVAVPVVVDGPIEAPSARLDATGLDKVGLLLDALFGGDHPRTCGVASKQGQGAALDPLKAKP